MTIKELPLAEIFIVSDATLSFDTPPDSAFTLPDVPGVSVIVSLASGEKCQRCWQHLPEVANAPIELPGLCTRCVDAVIDYRNRHPEPGI